MYGIIHKQIFDSTVIAEGFEVAYVFIGMVTLANENHVCDMGEVALAQRLFIPLHKLKEAIQVLSKPDSDSKSPEHEGRRIIPLKDMDDVESNRGWFVVNREEYIRMASVEYKRSQDRVRQKRKRDKNNETPGLSVTDNEMSQVCHDNINRDINKDKNNSAFIEFWDLYPKKLNKKKAQLAFNNLTKQKQVLAVKDLQTRFINTPQQYIPHPTTYIHGERWEDERETTVTQRKEVVI